MSAAPHDLTTTGVHGVTDPLIQIQGINKSFVTRESTVTALAQVDLDIHPGWGTSTSPLASNSAELAAGSGTRRRPG